MRVLVIADHDPAVLGDRFEADVLAAGWRKGAPQCEVDSFVFSHCEPGMAAVWREHAAQAGGYRDTAFISACDPEPHIPPAQFAQDLADQFYAAVASGMSRVVLALPQFLEPDAGIAFLFALGRLLPGTNDLPAYETVAQVLAAQAEQDQTDQHQASGAVAQFVDLIAHVRKFCAGVDVVGAYAANMPLLGMHGMSGAASLAKSMAPEVAQEREREISELFHRMQGPYNKLESAAVEGRELGRLLLPGIGAHSTAASLKELTRHDGAGSAGGLGFGLLTVGARLLPAATVFATQFDLRSRIAQSDLVVVYLDRLDGRTFPDQVGHWAAQVATEFISPVVVLTHEQIMSVRELSGQQVASCYQVARGPQALSEMAKRLAKSWTPSRS